MPTVASGSELKGDTLSTNGNRPTVSVSVPPLDWLISPVTREDFFERYWEQKPLLIKRDDPGYFGSLLSFSDVDRVITTLDRRYPDICLKNANALDLTQADYTLPGGALDVVRIYQLFEKGATVALAFLDTLIPSLTEFCRSIERELSCPLQTNVYMTPPNAQGAKPHYDTHDVFVLQVKGSKRWTIFGTPLELPLQGQPFDAEVHRLGDTTLEFELNAGDVAYIPRGVSHEARSTDTVSLHITTGILRYTWADFLLEAIAMNGLDNVAFRKSLPPGFARTGFDRTEARRIFEGLLREASDGPGFDAAFDSFVSRFLSQCPPVLKGQMTQLTALSELTVDSIVSARQGIVYRFQTEDSLEIIETYGRRILFPSHAREELRFALNSPKFVIKNLPGNLDDAGKLTLVRRLIREGLVMTIADEDGALPGKPAGLR